jgi:hypothetical protein
MQMRRFVAPLLVSLASMGLTACGTMEYRNDYSSVGHFAPIDVIESNYVESTLDAEIALLQAPWLAYEAA